MIRMVNKKECYKALSCKSGLDGSRVIAIRVPNDFPLNGEELKLFIELYGIEGDNDEFNLLSGNLSTYLSNRRDSKNGKNKN